MEAIDGTKIREGLQYDRKYTLMRLKSSIFQRFLGLESGRDEKPAVLRLKQHPNWHEVNRLGIPPILSKMKLFSNNGLSSQSSPSDADLKNPPIREPKIRALTTRGLASQHHTASSQHNMLSPKHNHRLRWATISRSSFLFCVDRWMMAHRIKRPWSSLK